jgi:hypothetical protein
MAGSFIVKSLTGCDSVLVGNSILTFRKGFVVTCSGWPKKELPGEAGSSPETPVVGW